VRSLRHAHRPRKRQKSHKITGARALHDRVCGVEVVVGPRDHALATSPINVGIAASVAGVMHLTAFPISISRRAPRRGPDHCRDRRRTFGRGSASMTTRMSVRRSGSLRLIVGPGRVRLRLEPRFEPVGGEPPRRSGRAARRAFARARHFLSAQSRGRGRQGSRCRCLTVVAAGDASEDTHVMRRTGRAIAKIFPRHLRSREPIVVSVRPPGTPGIGCS
jgi:hypothetical protein